MYPFEYERTDAVSQATALAREGAQYLAGGQTLLPTMRQRLAQPDTLVDLSGISELIGVSEEGSNLEIGAMTTHQAVSDNPIVQSQIPALARVAGGIGDRQVRARGTLGGSLANNDPAACYPAAVLGLNATVITDQREIPADDYFQGMYSTALEPGELITGVRFPMIQSAGYIKFLQPASRFALVGVMVARTDDGVRVAITGAGDGVFRHAGLEAALNANFSPEAVQDVVVDADDLNSDLHASAEYRAHLIKVLTRQAVAQALGKEE